MVRNAVKPCFHWREAIPRRHERRTSWSNSVNYNCHIMSAPDTGELRGLTELGSRKEALSRAAEFLGRPGLTDEAFREALQAILTHDFFMKCGKYQLDSA